MINFKFKKYDIFISFLTWPIFIPFIKNRRELLVFFIVHIVAIINLLFYKKIVKNLLNINYQNKTYKRIFFYSIFKLFLIVLSLFYGVQIIGNKIIICLINYVLIIFGFVLLAKIRQRGV